MGAILYKVPYEIRVLAVEVSTGKRVGTRHYYRTQNQLVAPPAYGGTITGTGSTATFLANFKTLWDALTGPLMSVNWQMELLEMRSIVGRQFGRPNVGIATVGTTLTETSIVTSSPHGFAVGNSIFIQNFLAPLGLNGLKTVSTVVSPVEFRITGVFAGPYLGAPTVQQAAGYQQWVYGDKETLVDTTAGVVAGDGVAAFADASILRLNEGVGKSFRSRFSLAPIAETQVSDGKFTNPAQAAWAAALNTFNAFVLNGGTEVPGSGQMFAVAVSQKLAFAEASPFTSSANWTKAIGSYLLHQFMGSQVKRKQRRLS